MDPDCAGSCQAVRSDSGELTDEILIRIDPRYHTLTNTAKLALIHELVHLKLGLDVGHGKKWDDEIKRLCKFKSYRRLL